LTRNECNESRRILLALLKPIADNPRIDPDALPAG
jgi:hypothetical protein